LKLAERGLRPSHLKKCHFIFRVLVLVLSLVIVKLHYFYFYLLLLFFFSASNDGQEFAGSIHQRVTPELETAVNLSWTSGTNATRFALGCRYELDKSASVSVSTLPL
jgi:hypothetical protein